MAGRIHIDLFTTLDGVAQAPGGPDEDTDSGFAFGGWQAPPITGAEGDEIIEGIRRADALLLGRRTYDIFAAFWPHHVDGPDGEIGQKFDRIPKYVASRGEPQLPWRDSHLLGTLDPDLAAAIDLLRDRHEEIHVIGSVDFSRALVTQGLFDQLNLWVYPITLGAGKRLFPAEGQPTSLTLPEPPVVSAGAVLLRYGWVEGTPATGDMTPPDSGS